MQKLPKPVSSSLGSHQTIFALDSLNWVRDIELTAHANKIGLAIIFEFNHDVKMLSALQSDRGTSHFSLRVLRLDCDRLVGASRDQI